MSQESRDLLILILNLQKSLDDVAQILKDDLHQEDIKSKRVIEAMRDSLPDSIKNEPKAIWHS